jgi:hypothetical protein
MEKVHELSVFLLLTALDLQDPASGDDWQSPEAVQGTT